MLLFITFSIGISLVLQYQYANAISLDFDGLTGLISIPGIDLLKGEKGDTGAQGPAGEKGEKGDTGLPRTQKVTERFGSPVQINRGETSTATTTCLSGEKATGGGYTWQFKDQGDDHIIFDESTTSNNNGWEVTAKYIGTFPSNTLTAFAECSILS